MEEAPELSSPKPLLSGAVPLEAFLASLHKVGENRAWAKYANILWKYHNNIINYATETGIIFECKHTLA